MRNTIKVTGLGNSIFFECGWDGMAQVQSESPILLFFIGQKQAKIQSRSCLLSNFWAPYLQHFIFFATYAWAQYQIVCHLQVFPAQCYVTLVLGPFISYKEIKFCDLEALFTKVYLTCKLQMGRIQAKVLYYCILIKLARDKHLILFGPFCKLQRKKISVVNTAPLLFTPNSLPITNYLT